MATKADYVRSQGQTRKHHCHWPGCEKQVPPAMWGCKDHWFKLPRELQLRIWSSYRPGQEIDGKPSANYLADAEAVQAWIAEHTKQPSLVFFTGHSDSLGASSGDRRFMVVTSDAEQKLDEARKNAHRALDAASKAWYEYAGMCEVGPDRTRAFDVYEKVHNARRL